MKCLLLGRCQRFIFYTAKLSMCFLFRYGYRHPGEEPDPYMNGTD